MKPISGQFLSTSEAESKRFGFHVVRGNVPGSAPPDAICVDIALLKPDIAIFRCPAGETRHAWALIRAGFTPIHADTLVYYGRSLSDALESSLPEGVVVRLATPTDQQALASIVRRSFLDYKNHYHANPLLEREAILEGYVEWALAYVSQQHAKDRSTWIISSRETVHGFATCKLNRDKAEVEIVLNATDPCASGRGLYTHLLTFIMKHYRTAGLASIAISTQVWNYGVQRVWVRSGLVLKNAYDTYHVNSLFNTPKGT